MSDEELEKLAKAKALQGLPMDEASRLARAKEMGFDVDNVYFHGTTAKDFSEFYPGLANNGKGIYFTQDLHKANAYATNDSPIAPRNARIIPTFVKGELFDPDNSEHIKKLNELRRNKSYDPEKYDKHNSLKLGDLRKDYNTDELVDELKSLGFSGRKIGKGKINSGYVNPETFEWIDTPNIEDEIVVFDPKNIRSKFAKFDPAMAESADISSFVPKTKGEKAIGAAIKGLGVLDKGLAHAGKLAIGADIAQGNIPEAAISAAEFAAPKLGAAATRAAPFLDLLRPESTQTQEQEEAELEQAKFNKLKQALKKRGLAVE